MRRLGERCLRAERREEMFRVYLPDPQACLLSKAGRRFPAAVRGKPKGKIASLTLHHPCAKIGRAHV